MQRNIKKIKELEAGELGAFLPLSFCLLPLLKAVLGVLGVGGIVVVAMSLK